MNHTHSTRTDQLIGALQVILAGICWGTLGIIASKLADLGFDSFSITILRIVTAGVIVLVLIPKLLPELKGLTFKASFGLIMQSLIGVLGMTLCYFYAVNHVGVSMAVALLYTAPVFSLILARVILGERISATSALLAVVAVIGVGCLMVGADSFSFNSGVLIGLLSGVCYALYGILGKKAMSKNHSSYLVFFSSVTVSAATLLILPTTYQTYGALFELPVQAWAFALGLGLIGTIVPFFLYMSALQKLPASTASVFTIVEPLTAIALAVFLLHQPLTIIQMIGTLLIVTATAANALIKR
ncbi:DMT family transporter [Moraxella canis]|uniref:DMT family transporter n=1 Tax=Moraxella canis TaxID=90239 RepID=UPI0006660774|nr:EamA family transporter [Moraxella canis]